MALKALLLKRKIEEMNGRMAALSQHTGELTQREAELEQAMDCLLYTSDAADE